MNMLKILNAGELKIYTDLVAMATFFITMVIGFYIVHFFNERKCVVKN